MKDNVPSNDVPMLGKGIYNSQSQLQREAMLKVLPMLEKSAQQLSHQSYPTDRPLSIVDYGAAQGSNSIELMQMIIQNLPNEKLQLLSNDRPNNDFNTLSTTTAEWTNSLINPAYIGLIPRSFYNQLLPANSVDLAFCLTCLQHLNDIPATHDENLQRFPDAEARHQNQAHDDLLLFLEHRAIQMKPQGSLILCFSSTSASGHRNLSGIIASCYDAVREMATDGRLSREVVAAFQDPLYERTMDDVLGSLGEVSESWCTREIFEDWVFHPAIGKMETTEAHGVEELEASQKYADTVVDWFMAVLGGFFRKALRVW
ncbi:SAM dependent carboxyl methyltransferase domain-containing protein [Penicillium maclennaniae]|uniref:SAM dependent carboxyl methyltransferase domain-containing protein n=1 Tax=Penicillium maclennaniae TaxID=1343394 RepID=UPI00253F75FA|nr:SAM dependent carboxyl methyltransferase domain-containing protein [Penicillium maclennaniae]KAJ5670119.1 SAM dependent carboxyl methyltransferase domain-containing protein [Penicillium maclennaniae]